MKKILLFLTVFSTLLSYSQVNLVKNLNPSSNDGVVGELIIFNNKVFFTGNNSNNTANFELFESDGTNAGTVLVKEISPSINVGGYPSNIFYWSNTNELYFSANGGVNAVNIELWKTDGTANGTIKVSEFNTTGSGTPNNITSFNNKLYMSAQSTNNGFELGTSDGTLVGSSILKDIFSGSNSSSPNNFFVFNNKLFFSANSNISGSELWTSNGTNAGTVLFKEINTGGSSNPDNFTVFNNLLYFSATNQNNGRELWITNGTAAGTQIIQDINPGITDSNPENFMVYNNRLYFTATTSIFGTELYYIDTNGTVSIANDIQSLGLNSNPSDLFIYNNKLYFNAGDGVNGRELWVTDGTIVGTIMLKDINPSGSSNPKFFVEYNGKLYFNANSKLWVTDGTTSGTQIISGSPTSPQSLVVLNDKLFFHANGGSGVGRELYTYLDPSLSTNEFNINNDVKLFPNPTTNSFSISTNQSINSISIYDITGKEVKTFKNTESYYNISKLTSGIYIIKIQTNKGVIIKKVVKK